MKRLLSMVILFVLVLTPLSVWAQDDELEWEEFTSEDGLLTLSYPADWIIQGALAEDPFPSVVIMNTQEAMDRYMDGEEPISGDQLVQVLLLPTEFFTLMGATVEPDAGALELAEAFATSFMGATMAEEDMGLDEEPEDDTEAEMSATEEAMDDGELTIGEPEEFEIEEDVTGAYVPVTEGNTEGAFIVTVVGEGLMAVTFIAAPPGEFTEEQAELGRQIAGSIAFAGTAEDIMNALMGGMGEIEGGMGEGEMGEAPAEGGMGEEGTGEDGATGATLDGDQLVNERCTVCHTRERIDAQDKDEAGWTETVDRMISYGAQLDDEERQTVIDYLVATH
ncbi:MAG: hypothetical protein GXY36_16315 [Chloroflexi bacterium]|nr:hypothetical protein [Chloroflexota bacterium]